MHLPYKISKLPEDWLEEEALCIKPGEARSTEMCKAYKSDKTFVIGPLDIKILNVS